MLTTIGRPSAVGHCDCGIPEPRSPMREKTAECGRPNAPRSGEARRSTAQHGTAWRSTAQHGTARRSTAQHGTARRSTAQHGTARHSTAQHSAAQHGAAQRKRRVTFGGIAVHRLVRTGRPARQGWGGSSALRWRDSLWLCFRAAEWVWLQTPWADGYGWPPVAVLYRFARSGIGLAGRRPESVVALHKVRPVHGVRVFRLLAPPTLRGLDLQHTTCAGSS